MSSIKITSLVAFALVCLAADFAMADNSNDCTICKSFVGEVQQNPEVLSIVEILYKPPFCSNETDCEQAREFVQTLEVLFMLFTPEENCKLVGICENDQISSRAILSKALRSAKKSGSFMGRVFGRKIATKINPYPVCGYCQEVVEDLQTDLKLTAKLFQVFCGRVPAEMHDDCEQLASNVMDKLKRQTSKQFCNTIGLCPKN